MANTASISVNMVRSTAVTETFSEASPGGTPVFDPQYVNLTLDASTTPAVTKHSPYTLSLTAGAATIDLTSLPGITEDETVDGSGLKVQMACFENPDTNANNMTITFGASNGYLLLGTAWKIILKPGQSFQTYLDDGAPVIDGTHKNIDVAGTGTQSLLVEIVMG